VTAPAAEPTPAEILAADPTKPPSGEGTPPEAGTPPVETEQKPSGTDPAPAPGEGTPETGQPAGDTTDSAPRGAPESYEFKAPEGFAFDDGVIKTFGDVARGLDLNQEAAQSVLDKMAPALREQNERQVAQMVDGWITELKADKDIGGLKLKETLQLAQKGLSLLTPEFRALLDAPAKGGTGLGNHKAVVASLAKLGAMVKEDTVFPSAGSDQPKPVKPLADRMYE
jgi:hypothetical protein